MPEHPLNRNDLPAAPSELRSLAASTALMAAELVRTERAKGFGVETKSTSVDMVNDVDKASDELITDLLTSARPNDALLTEESGATSGTSGITWIVDPIDGTTNFVYGHPPYAVSIAALVDGQPVASAVCDVPANECFTAALGEGADLNGTPLTLKPAPASMETALVATGFGYAAEMRKLQGAVVAELVHRVRDIRRLGSAATDLCWVAAGRIDAYFEAGLEDWDLYGGQLVATEAGAKLSLFNQAKSAHSLVVTHPNFHDELVDLLIELGADSI